MEKQDLKKSFTIRELPNEDRPRERLQKVGAESLSAQELLSVIMGRGIAGESVMVTAQRLLDRFGGLKGLSGTTVEELCTVRGIGLAKACQLKAIFEIAARVRSTEVSEKPVIKTPEDVSKLVQETLRDKKKEYFIALLLDTRNHLIKQAEISVGSLDSSIVHPREVFKEAVQASCAGIIFVHNHPSGETQPSREDIALSKRLLEAGQLMGIDILDHVIIGGNKFLSLKREGLF